MRAAQIRQWLVEALDRMYGEDTDMPFFPRCDLCSRLDTEGFLDCTQFNRAHYEACCNGDRVVGGTLFATHSGRVMCADCVVSLGQRGKRPEYGVTLSTLVLAGASLPSILAFWKAPVAQSECPPEVCHFSCEEIDDMGACVPCYLLYLTRLFPYTRNVGCDGHSPMEARLPAPVMKRVPIALQAMSHMALSTYDMHFTKALVMAALS